jgi:excisionase family DNA binding protein
LFGIVPDTRQGRQDVDQFPRKPFYSVAEVAAILGVSDTHVHTLISQGALGAIRISPRVTRISYGSLMGLVGQPLRVTRSSLSGRDVDELSGELSSEDVEEPDHRLALR